MNRLTAGLFPRTLGVWRSTALACAVSLLAGAHTALATTPPPTATATPTPPLATATPVPTALNGVVGTWVCAALACAVLIVVGTRTAQGGVEVWITHGLYGRGVTALAIDPHIPSTLYAASIAAVPARQYVVAF